MNYISHLHLASVSSTSLLGNFLGDFVKGEDLSYLPPEIRVGVKLHRKVDSFTDSHHEIAALRSGFPSDIRRVSGIILDVYFDFLLVSHWQQYTVLSLESTLETFYAQLQVWPEPINGRFAKTREGLLSHRWLIDYKQEQTCLRAYNAIESRFKGKITFADKADVYVKQNKKHIEQVFHRFYPDLIRFTRQSAKEFEQNEKG